MNPASTTSAGEWRVHLRHQGRIKGLPRGVGSVVQRGTGQPLVTRPGQSARLGLVADHGRHGGAMTLQPAALARCLDDGGHVGATAGNQDHNVFLFHANIPTEARSVMTPDTPHSTDGGTPSPRHHDFAQRPLTDIEARILGTLMEKARTVPDSYPLTFNNLTTGCNQKSSREPVMQLADALVAEALDELRQLHMVFESSGGRVTRYEHNFLRTVGIPEQSGVLLGMLMLRGPQTAGELRLNTERWYKFLDIASVDAFLEELQDRSAEKGGAAGGQTAQGARRARAALGAPAVRPGGPQPARGGPPRRPERQRHRRRRHPPQPARGGAGGNGGPPGRATAKTCTNSWVCHSPDRHKTNGRAKLNADVERLPVDP